MFAGCTCVLPNCMPCDWDRNCDTSTVVWLISMRSDRHIFLSANMAQAGLLPDNASSYSRSINVHAFFIV